MTQNAEYAVYTEFSTGMKIVEAGWNTRVFNSVDVQQGSMISCDTVTGVITLAPPGTYHIFASSGVTYHTDKEPTGTMTTESYPNAGYCRLRDADKTSCGNEDAIAIGTLNNANALVSLVETYLTTDVERQIVLEHQFGDENLGNIYLQSNVGDSPWHVFARISIRRL